MQLPRGSYYSLKKGIMLASLLQDLEEKQFTGFCTISSGVEAGSLVFNKGNCLLAQFRHLKGSEALKSLEVLQSTLNVELYVLSETQLNLALDFNSGFRTDHDIPDTGTRNKISDNDAHVHQIISRPAPPVRGLQLPRGILCKEQDLSLADLLDMLRDEKFSGYCSITLGNEKIHIVLDGGICLLASYPPEKGSSALQLLQTKVDDNAHAELYTLSPAQLKLALEFNKEFRVSASSSQPKIRIKPQKLPEKPLKRDIEPPRIQLKKEEFVDQLEALDTLNIEAMSTQIRDNFRDVVEGLDLGHLLEESDDNEEPEE